MATFVRSQNVQHRIGELGTFALKTIAGNVRLRGAETDTVTVRATYEIRAASEEEAERVFDTAVFVVEEAEGSLSMWPPDDRGSLGGALAQLLRRRAGADVSVEVELPHRASLRLEVVSADVQAAGLEGEQRYTSVSGDLYLTELGGQVRMATVSGDAILRADAPASVRAEAVSGDISVVAPRLDGLRANTVSGDVDVEARLGEAGEFRTDTVSGDLSIRLSGDATFEVRGISTDISSDIDHRMEGSADRRRVVVGNGRPRFIFNSMSGDLSILGSSKFAGLAEAAPSPPSPPAAPDEPVAAAEELAILRALERGEIDVDEATRRLAGGAARE